METVAASIVAAMTSRLNKLDGHVLAVAATATEIGENMVAQADLDAVATAVTAVATAVEAVKAQVATDNASLAADVTNIAAEIAKLQGANPALDLTGVNAAVSAAQTSVADLQAAGTALDSESAAVGGLVPPAPPAA